MPFEQNFCIPVPVLTDREHTIREKTRQTVFRLPDYQLNII